MDSEDDDGNAAKAFPATSPNQSNSRSPFSKFLSNLSPIKSARASQYTQRLSESSFPTTPSVFGSPRLDLQQHNTFLKRDRDRDEIAGSSSSAHGQCYSTSNSSLIPCIPKQFQPFSPAEGVDEYLAHHLEVENARSAQDTNDGIVDVGAHNLPHLNQKQLVPSTSLSDQRFDKMLAFSSENISNHVESNQFLERHVSQEPSQYERDIRRHLQFEGTMDCTNFDASHSGLSLSNVSSALTIGSDVISSKKLSGYQISTQETHINISSLMETMNDPIISTGREVIDLVDSDDSISEAIVAASRGRFPNNVEAPWNSQQVSCFQQHTLPYNGKLPAQHIAETERLEELSQDSSKGKRKRETCTDESEGCKRCNCKRSKCLKLYCECFAAGIYCVDSCACENCYNKPDYEDTVSVVREQIELRNPLAFAPTVVNHSNDSPNVADIDGNWVTPSSARHKRGCKCKRSKCLKKYCECYRAKVGCSDGCHCESCDNSFGKKSESIFQRAENQKNQFHEKLNTAEVMSDGTKGGISNQFSPAWEELVNIGHLSTLSHPPLRAVPCLTAPNMGDSPNVSQTQAQKGSGLQLSPGPAHLHWCTSDLSPTQACVAKLPHELNSVSAAACDIMEDGVPDMLQDNSNPTNILKSGSPKQKRVSSPLLQSDRLGSSSISGLLSGRKLILQSVPSFPSLTPYCNSEDRMNQTENDDRGRSHDQ